MKTRKMFTLAFAAVICTMTGCFRPDDSAAGAAAGKLVGYWEVSHIAEDNYQYDIYEDGTTGEPNSVIDSYDVICDDGRKEWGIMRFTESMMTYVATDDPELVGILDVPVPYTFDGKKLVSAFIQLDHGPGFAEVEFKNDDYMVLYILDEGYLYKDNGKRNGYEKCQTWTTFRRVTNEN